MRLRLVATASALCLAATGVALTPAVADALAITITVSGTVLDDAGNGLAGAEIRLNEDSAAYDDAVTVTSDNAGHYSTPLSLDGNRDIDVVFSNGDEWSDQLRGIDAQDGADVTGFDGQLQHLGSISGHLTSQISEVEGVYLHLTDGLTEYQDALNAEADGSYRFDGVPPGRYWLEVDAHAPIVYHPTTGSRDVVGQIVLDPGENEVIDFEADQKPDPQLGHLVVNYSGPGLGRNATVWAVRVGAGYAASATVTSDYPQTTLDVPVGQYKLAIDTNIWFGGFSRAGATEVTVTAGATTSVDVYLPSDGPDTIQTDYVTGRFESEEGVGISHLDVEVLRPDAPGEVVARTTTTYRGGFAVDRLPPGHYMVRASDATGAFRGRTVSIPEHPTSENSYVLTRVAPFGAAFPGPASASMGGRSLGGRGGPICLYPTNGRLAEGDLVCGRFDSQEDQRYALTSIKPGTYRIRLGEPNDGSAPWVGGRSESSATVFTFAAGEHKELDLPARTTSGHLTGKAVDRAARSLDGLTFLAYAADNPDEVVETAYGGSPWSMFYLDIRPYKIKVVDGTGRYRTTWLGGDDFESATAVTPLIDTKKALPPIVLDMRIEALAPPKISGTAQPGRILTATPGLWPSEDLSFTYQWLRDGAPISRATGATYTVTSTDVGRRLAVRVEGSDPWGQRATTISAATAAIARPKPHAPDRVTPMVHTTVKALGGRRVRVTLAFKSPGLAPTGRVTLRLGSKTVMKWRTLKNGRLTVVLKRQPKNRRVKYTVRYSGSSTTTPVTKQTARVRVR